MRTIILWLMLLFAACSPTRKLSQSTDIKVDSTAQISRQAEASRVVSSDYSGRRVMIDLKFAPLTPELISHGITTPPLSGITQTTEEAVSRQKDSTATAEVSQSETQLTREVATEAETTESARLAWWQRLLIWVGVAYIIRLVIKIASSWGNLTFKSLIKLF